MGQARPEIEGIEVQDFETREQFFEALRQAASADGTAMVYGMNVHAANLAAQDPDWKALIQQGDVVYCDGAGILLASKLLGTPLTQRYTAADWLDSLLADWRDHGLRVYFLAGEPGVVEKALARFDRTVPGHTIVGAHHGYILDDAVLEEKVIAEINRLKPDVVMVGMGMPLQEFWMARNRDRLDTRLLWAMGATLDYLTQKVPRCPGWVGKLGFEWLFRFCLEPKRLFKRYIVGNPLFLGRLLLTVSLPRLIFPSGHAADKPSR